MFINHISLLIRKETRPLIFVYSSLSRSLLKAHMNDLPKSLISNQQVNQLKYSVSQSNNGAQTPTIKPKEKI